MTLHERSCDDDVASTFMRRCMKVMCPLSNDCATAKALITLFDNAFYRPRDPHTFFFMAQFYHTFQYSFRFCGFEVLPPQIFYGMLEVSRERRTEMLEAWIKRLGSIWTETPLPFVSNKNFDVSKGHTLSDEYLEGMKEDKEGPTLGHHLGKLIPPGRKVEL